MKLVKMHRVLSFKQSNWLKPYVDFNTQKTKESTHEDDKDFLKLIVKSCESVRKRCNIKVINDKKIYQRCDNKPNFISSKIIKP